MADTQKVLGQIVGKTIEFAPRVVSIVKGIKSLFGKDKTGAEKKVIGKDVLKKTEEVVEGVTGKDLMNGDALDALLDEATELGYTVMKAEERLKEIGEQIKAIKNTPAPEAPAA